jgi:NADH-quinone oxidoreductase subunit N
MTRTDLLALAPLIVLTLTLAVVMLQIAVRRHHGAVMGISVAGLALALSTLPVAGSCKAGEVTALLTVDSQALFFTGLVLAATAATALLAYGYLERLGRHAEEFYLLLLMAAVGGVVLAMSRHFASFFIGLEILSISLYAMIAYSRRREMSLEAGLKYLILAAVSAAFLLFGMALIYAAVGSMDFAHMALLAFPPPPGAGGQRLLLSAGTALLLVGIGFKLALVPFHMWTPDVYQGAPAPVTGFVASVSKVALVALLIRLFAPVALQGNPALFWIFGLFAVASMVGGNLLALLQDRVKRILAYSSIAHMGYLLVAFMAGGRQAVGASAFYMAAYTITILGAFGVICVLSGKRGDADRLADFQGLAYRNPWIGGVFAAMLLSLAGIPLTVGFMGKFYIVTAGLRGALLWLVITLLLTSGVSLFYYLRIVVVLFTRPEEGEGSFPALAQMGVSDGLVLAAMSILLVWLGIGPGPLLGLIHGFGG